MDNKKTCPLLANSPDFPADRIQCTGDRCAWWDGDGAGGRCVLVSLAYSTAEISSLTESISDTQRAAFEREHPRIARRPPAE